MHRIVLTVGSVGYLVPRADFAGRIHSVFAQACNIACHGTLLTLGAPGAADGPTTLRLARGALHDLRGLFDVGEVVRCRQARMQTGRTELEWMQAGVWRPAPLRRLLPRRRIDEHLRHAGQRLAQRRSMHTTSVIDREGAWVVSALRCACRALDSERAVRHVARLAGWGEGLTPAGDDFLIGLMAGLDALARDDPRRREFRRALAGALDASTQRTTPIAAHYLRLAAGGHYTEPLVRLRNALLCEDDGDAVDPALHSALAVGATSGADTVSGLLAGLGVWLPAPAAAEAA
ncbi:MAG TPA: DUF2877 domain-containing protein [Burkholderiaceae bacterium]